MSFGQQFLQGFFPPDGLKDYAHANLTFAANGYQLAPRYKFLFYVYFNLNTAEIPTLQSIYGSGSQASLGIMAKTAQLPGFKMSVETMNQYNRKRLVQSKLEYDPVQITLHDDQSDMIRGLWYNYYTYYYKDSSYKYNGTPVRNGSMGALQTQPNGFSYGTRDIYAPERQQTDWGYIGEAYADGSQTGGANNLGGGKPAFFRDITIYGFSQKTFAQYTLINPMIESWNSETYDNSQGNGTMAHNMTIRYETVKYYSGAVGSNTPSSTVPGFADPAHYDTVRSSLATPGSTQTIIGQGGLLDAGEGIINDLEAIGDGSGGLQSILGAVQKAGTAYNTFKNANWKSIAQGDWLNAQYGLVQYALPGAVRYVTNSANGMLFPTPPKGSLPNITYGPPSI